MISYLLTMSSFVFVCDGKTILLMSFLAFSASISADQPSGSSGAFVGTHSRAMYFFFSNNEFITCIHEFWIYPSTNFFHQIFFVFFFKNGFCLNRSYRHFFQFWSQWNLLPCRKRNDKRVSSSCSQLGGILADFWIPNEIDSLNFQHILLFWFCEASQNLSLFR